jgi:hypothetical protein
MHGFVFLGSVLTLNRCESARHSIENEDIFNVYQSGKAQLMALGYSFDVLESSFDQVVSFILKVLINFPFKVFLSHTQFDVLAKSRKSLSFA